MNTLKSLLIAITSLLAVSSATAAKPLFPDLENCPDIATVYISKGMLMNATSSREVLWNKLNIYNSKDLDDLYIYSSKTPEGIEVADKALGNFLKKNPDMEILMRTKSKKESCTIYAMPLKDTPNRYSSLIIVTQGNSFSMVVLTGKINLDFGAGGDNQLDNLKLFDGLKDINNLDFLSDLKDLEGLDLIDTRFNDLDLTPSLFNDLDFDYISDEVGEELGKDIVKIVNKRLSSKNDLSKGRKSIAKSKKALAKSKKGMAKERKYISLSKKELSKMKSELKSAAKSIAKESAKTAISYVMYM